MVNDRVTNRKIKRIYTRKMSYTRLHCCKLTYFGLCYNNTMLINVVIKYFSPRPEFTSQLVHRLAFGTTICYIESWEQINHGLAKLSYNCGVKSGLMSDFPSKIVPGLAFGTSKFYIVTEHKINYGLVNLSYNRDVNLDLMMINKILRPLKFVLR